jgi:hypothetical protein
MNISQFIETLQNFQDYYGDIPVVLCDLDTGGYFTMTPDNIEAQSMNDGSTRLSIGVNDYTDPREPEPALRHII